MKLLIVYATTEGQTRKMVRFLKDKAVAAGHQVDLFNALDEPLPPDGYDRVIIAASIHVMKYQAAIRHYTHDHHAALNNRPSAFLSVSLAAAGDDQDSWQELKNITENSLEEAGWQPTVVHYAAGALRYTRYDFFKKFIMRMIAKKQGGSTDTTEDHEYTDWKKLEAFLKEFLAVEVPTVTV